MRRLFLIVSSGLLLLASCARRSEVAVVVDPVCYDRISDAVDSYVKAIDSKWKKGVLLIDRWGVPDSLRAELQSLYRNGHLEGAVLIGDIPIPMIRDAQHLCTAFKMDQSQPWQRSSVPSDRYYDDFGLDFKFIKKDESDSLLYYYSLTGDGDQRVSCDIYTARIKAPEGPDKYAAIADFLLRAAEKHHNGAQAMDKVLFFSGHGYNSNSMHARIDEAQALREHFPFLKEPSAKLEYLNHDFERFVGPRLLAALDDGDLDLALLHHHGSPDLQYMNGSPYVSSPDGWIEQARRYFRGKIRDAKDPKASRQYFMSRFGVPAAWLDDANDPAMVEQDSIYAESVDIHLADIDAHCPQAAVVMLDACFNGAFIHKDYLAAHYIFHPGGGTMAVRANTVNTLQDIWPDEQCGLLALGVCAGNWAKGELTLENHLFGDPTFAFASSGRNDEIDHLISTKGGNSRVWRKLLKSDSAELRCLSVKNLYKAGKISSDALLKIQREDPSAIVRLEAFNLLCFRRDASLTGAIRTALDDSYELTRRLGAKIAAKHLAPELMPILVEKYMDPNCTIREVFHIKDALEGYEPSDVLAEFAKRPYWRGEEAARTFDSSLARADSVSRAEYASLGKGVLTVKQARNLIKTERNKCSVKPLPAIFLLLEDENADEGLRVTAAEVLGWYNFSYKRDEVMERCTALAGTVTSGPLKAELNKTVARLKSE